MYLINLKMKMNKAGAKVEKMAELDYIRQIMLNLLSWALFWCLLYLVCIRVYSLWICSAVERNCSLAQFGHYLWLALGQSVALLLTAAEEGEFYLERHYAICVFENLTVFIVKLQ